MTPEATRVVLAALRDEAKANPGKTFTQTHEGKTIGVTWMKIEGARVPTFHYLLEGNHRPATDIIKEMEGRLTFVDPTTGKDIFREYEDELDAKYQRELAEASREA